jgi:uncharacterized FlgJ-related protein
MNLKIFVENNNLFGMKEARVRLNLAKGTQYGHAYYDDWKESVSQIMLYGIQRLHTNVKTRINYIHC